MEEEQLLTDYEERELFKHMVKYHSPEYYQGLFENSTQYRGLPIKSKGGGTENPDYDNCIDNPPAYPKDPDYPDRICTGGYYCKMSNRRWGCRYSVSKNPDENKGFNPK